jgi:hypothetical protein
MKPVLRIKNKETRFNGSGFCVIVIFFLFKHLNASGIIKLLLKELVNKGS